jgi:hypothetical protein
LNGLEQVYEVARNSSIEAKSKVAVVSQRELEGIKTKVNLPKKISGAIERVKGDCQLRVGDLLSSHQSKHRKQAYTGTPS